MWELDNKKGWVPSNWCLQILVLAKTHKNPLDGKEIKSVNTKGNKPWIFIGSTDAEAESPILWPPEVKNWLIGKDPDAGKDWRQEEKRATEDEIVGWHHQLKGLESGKTPGDSKVNGSLVCCTLWGCKESNTTEWLNNQRTEAVRFLSLKWEESALNAAVKFWFYLFAGYCSGHHFAW